MSSQFHIIGVQTVRKEVIATDQNFQRRRKLRQQSANADCARKYEERLPCRKIESLLDRQYKLKLTASTILDVTRRVAPATPTDLQQNTAKNR